MWKRWSFAAGYLRYPDSVAGRGWFNDGGKSTAVCFDVKSYTILIQCTPVSLIANLTTLLCLIKINE
jgi:hypothetical protein